jgi:hypothetical protein
MRFSGSEYPTGRIDLYATFVGRLYSLGLHRGVTCVLYFD